MKKRRMFLDDLGLDVPGSSKLINATYDLLNLQTYFTAGPKEVRAWTILNCQLHRRRWGYSHRL